MSRARAMVTSLNYLLFYKQNLLQCIRTNPSHIDTPFKALALSFVNKFSTLNSHESAFDFQNPNQTRNNSCKYDKHWSSTESDTEYDSESCTETESDIEDYFDISEFYNFDYCHETGEDFLRRHPTEYYSSMLNFHHVPVPSDSQPNFGINFGIGKERQLLGTIEELDAFCKDRDLYGALKVLGLLEQKNVSVDIHKYLYLMNGCGELKAVEEARYLHHHLKRSVPCLDVYTHNKFLEMYLKCGSMEDAYQLFDEMPQRNLTSWDTMITGLAKNGCGKDAIEMFTEFKKVGLKPDNQIFHGVFAACGVIGDMKAGLSHLESMRNKYSLVPSMDDYVSVVDMFGSSGHLNEALEFIEKMPIKPSVEIWVTMMNQSRVHGDLELGDQCAEIVNLLDPSLLDEHSKKGLIPLKPSDKTQIHEYNMYNMFRDTSQPENEKLIMQLWCLKQPMIEAGYVPDTRIVRHELSDVDQESKEESLLLHSEPLAISHALLTSPARTPITIHNRVCICRNCHNALKIISQLVGRLIIARDESKFHHYKNVVCSCEDYW